jgi:hypothetical protein
MKLYIIESQGFINLKTNQGKSKKSKKSGPIRTCNTPLNLL